jgi:hypothetical protein
VFYNGSKLASNEFTATNGTTFVLATACQANDIVQAVVAVTGGGIGGSGTTNYISKWTASGVLGNSTIQDNGTTITLGSALSGTTGTFSGQVEGTIINSTSNAFRLNGNNALSLVTLNSQSVVKINAAGFWGTQLVGANDKGILINNTGEVQITSRNLSVTNNVSNEIGVWLKGIGTYSSGYASLQSFASDVTYDTKLVLQENGGKVFIGTTSANITSNMRLSVKQTLGEGAAEVWTSWAGDVSTAAFWVIKYDNVNTTSQIFQRFAINNGSTACGQINANGASQVAFGSYSDIRLKENITELEPQLDKILALKPCEFDYKDGSGHQIGFIAQEMQEVYPDVVNESLDGMLTLSGWNKTEARLVKAIQEQNQLISELRKELDELKQLVK